MSRTSTEAGRLEEAAEPESELARWLVEVGRRKRGGRRLPEPVPLAAGPKTLSMHRVALIATMAAALLQYVYLDVQLEIASLRSVIVFVFTGGHG